MKSLGHDHLIPDSLILNNVPWREYLDENVTGDIRHPHDYRDAARTFLEGEENRVGAKLPFTWDDDFRILPNSLTLWSGINGHGKSLITQQAALYFLNQQYSSREEKILIWSPELPPEVTVARILKQATGLKNPTEKFQDEIFDFIEDRLYLYVREHNVTPNELIGMIRFAVQELKVTTIILDSLMKVRLTDRSDNLHLHQKNFCNTLANECRGSGLSIFLVVHSRKRESENQRIGKFDVKGSGDLVDLCDCLIAVSRNKKKSEAQMCGDTDRDDEPDGWVSVQKNRHGGIEPSFPVWFLPEPMQFVKSDRERPLCLIGRV